MSKPPELQGYKIHPAAEIFPLMSEERLEELTQDMRVHGFDKRHPVIILDKGGDESEDLVVDGRNRLIAAQRAGVTPAAEYIKEEENPWNIAWRFNAIRRDLEPTQRAAIWLRANEGLLQWEDVRTQQIEDRWNERVAARRQVKASEATLPQASERKRAPQKRDVYAAQAGVSPRTMQTVMTAKKEEPEVFEAMVAGKVAGTKWKRRPTQATQALIEQIRKLDEDKPYAPDETKAAQLGITANRYSQIRRQYIVGVRSKPTLVQQQIDAVEDMIDRVEALEQARPWLQSTPEEVQTFKEGVRRLRAALNNLEASL